MTPTPVKSQAHRGPTHHRPRRHQSHQLQSAATIGGLSRTFSVRSARPVQRVPAYTPVADDRLVFEPPVVPVRGSTAFPLVRYTPAASACGLPGCATTYSRRPIARDPRPHMLTYEGTPSIDVFPSAPRPSSTFLSRGPQASTPSAASQRGPTPAHSVRAYNTAAAFSSAPPGYVAALKVYF